MENGWSGSLILASDEERPTWVHPNVTVKPSVIHGKGFFATRPIKNGEVVFVFGGTLFSREDIEAGKANKRTLMQVSEGLWLGNRSDQTEGEDYFINHSCEPNLWMENESTLVALRDISTGEEVTMDYAMHFADPEWKMRSECRCGSPLCRQIITGRDWKLKDLQDRYKGRFSPLLDKRIDALGKTGEEESRKKGGKV